MKMRKGFTLVELLIVIVIIGILAAAMLLSSGSATASAEASNIISDLRNLKAAALMCYADSMDTFSNPNTGAPSIEALARYMDNSARVTAGGYGVKADGGKWYVGYNASLKNAEVRSKLAGKASSVGLIASGAITQAPTSTDAAYTGQDAVWMVAR